MTRTPVSAERVVPLPEAVRRAGAALAHLGLTPDLVDMGEGREPAAWHCRLRGPDGVPAPSAEGMGKGRRAEARAGALFEALEHYLTGPALFDPAAVEPVEPARIAAGPLRADASAVLLDGRCAAPLACHRYQGPEGAVPVPLFLSAPWYVEADAGRLRERAGDAHDYTGLMRYSCNSGSAVGVTATEALLHALNETVERDALSLLLVRAFLGTGERLSVVDPRTLPPELARAYAVAGQVAGAPVHLLDITGDLKVPTMLAYVAPTPDRPHRRGAGTSLSPAHAAWRALTELVQTTVGERIQRRGDAERLARHPELLACGRFDLTEHLRAARTVPFPEDGARPGRPRDQLREVAARLGARGYTPLTRTVAVLPGRITAVHVVVPGLERFMLVVEGNLVLPGPRGRAAVRHAVRAGDGERCDLPRA
ncbi:YcaO-like family protein [Microbispora triticiradicis]|uniref:YcaO-like family protein n=1 Tax=Microbispora triticiradicis TaxID=2200763 RepID=UPI001AD70F50|nr:YcaO-like family protein [Microbispora triticiradicis]MBO4273209.1 hypothetical protein [Microbispora triticiradicis]